MWHILKNPDHPLTTVIKGSDINYPSFIRQGYTSIHSGMKSEIEKKQEELIQNIVYTLTDVI